MGSQSHYRGVLIKDRTYKESPEGFVVNPRALDIVWGNDSRYWRIPNNEDEPVELLQVSWVEMSGSLPLKWFEKKTYKLCFKVSLQPDAFGWQGSPVYMMVKVGNAKQKWKKYDLSTAQTDSTSEIPVDFTFDITENDKNSEEKLRFGLYEIWRGRWKGGLLIHEVKITPIPRL